ncbi:hypothetical protein MU448_12190 [Streptococcus sp. O1]|uniref:HK97 gp10 family phage protein n=1 Tax=Streptococcus sp. O1 TaxID=2928735 RepID=UPI00211AB1DA|nr:HK97 gp10 family phage protein [Streptococcus sp. O1]MCQ9215048.1 hypothetical protein [Streptococcus sp. O1]MCQ9215097.1 hypothetical protein [Streptococcus sp. O1]
MASADSLSHEIAKALSEYSEEVENATDELAEETANKAVSTLKVTSPRKSAKYASHWKVTKNKKGATLFTMHQQPIDLHTC